jgi:hypothetical protein
MMTNVELRSITCQLRAAGGNKIEGYAAVFDSEYDCGDFKETIRSGAFNSVVRDDVCCLLNHDPNRLLGRTSAGTMSIAQDSKGLHYECDLPDTDSGRDVHSMVKRGDLKGSSFSFLIKTQRWNSEGNLREILELEQLFDCGPVTYPAYTDTSVNARSQQRQFRSVGICTRPQPAVYIPESLERKRLDLLLQIARLKL